MNSQQRIWNIAGTVGVLLIVFLAVLSIKDIKSIAYVGVNSQSPNTISVEGIGDAVAVPDVATFSFTVTETAPTVTAAQSQATDKTNSALKTVRDGGVADKDIQTTAYSISPHYEYSSGVCTVNSCPPSKSVLTGYDVSQTIEVKVRNLTKAGDLFASIGSAGVEDVNGLDFSVDDPDSVNAQARSAAISNAQFKAVELARELGVSLVRVTGFSESSPDQPRPIMYAMSAAVAPVAGSAAPEVPAGQQKVTSDVTVTYEIK